MFPSGRVPKVKARQATAWQWTEIELSQDGKVGHLSDSNVPAASSSAMLWAPNFSLKGSQGFCLYPSCKLFVCCYVPPKSPKIAKCPGIIVCFVYTCISTVMGPTCFQEIKIAERVLGLLSFFNLTCSECCNQMCPMCTHSGPYMRPVYLICSLQGGSLKLRQTSSSVRMERWANSVTAASSSAMLWAPNKVPLEMFTRIFACILRVNF